MKPSARQVIRDCLAKLNEELKQFDQTTHGVIPGDGLMGVLVSIRETYNTPNAYNISTLSQCITWFLKQEKDE